MIVAALQEGIDFKFDVSDELRHTLVVPDENGTITKMVKDEDFWNELERWQIPIEGGFSQRVYTNFVPENPKAKNLVDFNSVTFQMYCNTDVNITGLTIHRIPLDQVEKLTHHKKSLKL